MSRVPAMEVDSQARVEELLGFYRQRGYDRRVGFGQRPAILVIDFSRAFTGGRSDFPGGEFSREIAQTLRMLELARRGTKVPVLFTTIAYDEPLRDAALWGKKVPWLEHCRAGTPMVEIDPALNMQPGEPVIAKKFPSSFYGTRLEDMLRDKRIDTLILAGCTTSVCVRATALDAMQRARGASRRSRLALCGCRARRRGRGLPRETYSNLRLRSFTSFDHFCTSREMVAASASGVPPAISIPSAVRRSRTSGC
jgi:nicotinamidase-related amidase